MLKGFGFETFLRCVLMQEKPSSLLIVIRGIPISSYCLHPIQFHESDAAQYKWNKVRGLLSFIPSKSLKQTCPYACKHTLAHVTTHYKHSSEDGGGAHGGGAGI